MDHHPRRRKKSKILKIPRKRMQMRPKTGKRQADLEHLGYDDVLRGRSSFRLLTGQLRRASRVFGAERNVNPG